MNNIGVIGNGFVGSAIVSGFSLHSNIRIHDADSRKSTHSLAEVVNDSEYVFVCVPTPMHSSTGGRIDTSIIESVFNGVVEQNYDDTIYTISWQIQVRS